MMKKLKWAAIISGSLLAGAGIQSSTLAQQLPQLGHAPINEVIAELTLAEKVKLIRGTGMDLSAIGGDGPAVGVTIDDRVPGAAGNTYAVSRLGIPSLVLADGPAGLRIKPTRDDTNDTFYCTAFPIATLLASSWDVDLVEKVGRAIGNEVKEYGVDILLAPALNIHRYPLGGRNYEYYSEDPVVSGSMAAAMVNGIQSHGVGTSIKHYVANNHEWNRFGINVKSDERALREIYLKGFEISIKESAPWTVMSSYNQLNGTPTSESKKLLTDVLRQQWGFKGVVMTDWFGGTNPIAQMTAGNDLLMPGTDKQERAVIDAVKSGQLDESVLDRNIENILNIVSKSPIFNGYKYSNKPDLKANALTARQAAADGMILLKNDATLPLSSSMRLAVLGNNSYQMVTGGTGSGDVNEAYSISMEQGLNSAGLIADTTIAQQYKAYLAAEIIKQPIRTGLQAFLPAAPIAEYVISDAQLAKLAANNDAALLTIGRSSGEFSDRKAKNDFYLNEKEQQLIDRANHFFHAQNKPVIVILNIGGVIETSSWRDNVDAILLAWQPGQEAGNAIADVLIGNVNPSGKLTTTFSNRLEDFLAAENFPGVITDTSEEAKLFFDHQPAEVEYKDGIFVGYRYFNTQHKAVAYPFGFGLSYTQFKYENLTLSESIFNDELTVSITVKNSGMRPGKEVVQLYVSAPNSKLTKPREELRDFAKTKLLAPNESQTLTFKLTNKDLASFDPHSNKWVADAGNYRVKIGASSTDFRQIATFKKQNVSYLEL